MKDRLTVRHGMLTDLASWYTVTDEIKNISSRMLYGCAGSENIVT